MTCSAPKKLNPRIRSQSHHVTMRRSHLKRTIERIRRRSSKVKGGNTLGSGKNRLRPSTSTPPMSWRKRRRSVTLMKSRVLIMIRKATLLATASSQKTSIGFGNLCAGNWWWWGSCQGVLHPIPGPISGETGKGPAQ